MRTLTKYIRALARHTIVIPRQLLLVDLFRWLVALVRAIVFLLVNRGVSTYSDHEHKGKISDNALMHNMKGLWADLYSVRPHLLIRPLLSIDFVRKNSRELKVLVVGPRSENELLTLVGYGFRLKNIVGVDLISYSPRVKLGDMHSLPEKDDSFDITLCGWTLAYSDDKPLAAKELARVTKPGGIVAISASSNPKTNKELSESVGYVPGSRERFYYLSDLESLFTDMAEWHYFRQDRVGHGEVAYLMSIFRKKRSSIS